MIEGQIYLERDRPVDVKIDNQRLWVTLYDGRIISHPLAWYPWLANATTEQQQQFELWTAAVWWTDLDEGILVETLLKGIEAMSQVG